MITITLFTRLYAPKLVPFSKFYGKVGVISWFLFHLIRKNYVLYWDFDMKSWIVDFFTRFTRKKTPQNNFSSQNFSVENNYVYYCFHWFAVLKRDNATFLVKIILCEFLKYINWPFKFYFMMILLFHTSP